MLSPQRLKNSLMSKFDVLAFVDLADVVNSRTLVYKIFEQNFKPQYHAQERFVFYTGSPVNATLIKNLQHAADIFDVSRCFILVCCPNNPMSDHAPGDIEFLKISVDSLPLLLDNVIDFSKLCALPWMQIGLMNNGNMQVCCENTTVMGKCNVDLPAHAFFSNDMHRLRQEFLSGQQPKDCQTCWKVEQHGLLSVRQWGTKLNQKSFFTQYLDQPTLRSIDIRPSTVCNFKCRICSSEYSSLWTEEELKFNNDAEKKIFFLDQIKQGRWFDENVQISDQLSSILPQLANIDFYGGEPVLSKQLLLLLTQATQQNVAKNLRLHFNTNASIYPANLIPLLEQFREIDICFSIDNIGQRFELERGGNWTSVDSNIKQFLKLDRQKFILSTLTTVSILSVLYLDELFDWADQHDLPVNLNLLHYPNYLSILNLTATAQNLVIAKYQNHPRTELRQLAEMISKSVAGDGVDFVAQMKKLDQRRHQNVLNSHNEIAIAMGYSI